MVAMLFAYMFGSTTITNTLNGPVTVASGREHLAQDGLREPKVVAVRSAATRGGGVGVDLGALGVGSDRYRPWLKYMVKVHGTIFGNCNFLVW